MLVQSAVEGTRGSRPGFNVTMGNHKHLAVEKGEMEKRGQVRLQSGGGNVSRAVSRLYIRTQVLVAVWSRLSSKGGWLVEMGGAAPSAPRLARRGPRVATASPGARAY